LDQGERGRPGLLFEYTPDLKRAYDLREELTDTFETDHTKESGAVAIKRRLKSVSISGLNCIRKRAPFQVMRES